MISFKKVILEHEAIIEDFLLKNGLKETRIADEELYFETTNEVESEKKLGASPKDKTSRSGCIGKGILLLLLLGVIGNLLNFCTGTGSNLPTPSLKQSNESPVEKGSVHDEWKP